MDMPTGIIVHQRLNLQKRAIEKVFDSVRARSHDRREQEKRGMQCTARGLLLISVGVTVIDIDFP